MLPMCLDVPLRKSNLFTTTTKNQFYTFTRAIRDLSRCSYSKGCYPSSRSHTLCLRAEEDLAPILQNTSFPILQVFVRNFYKYVYSYDFLTSLRKMNPTNFFTNTCKPNIAYFTSIL
jgi:hypothetical protein